MSEDPLSVPIYSINNDVLLYIFAFNADMFDDRQALDTTRITSQVCGRWRDLMLETPSLWAKLVDMDRIFGHKSGEWRDELIRRTGAAPLWIRVTSWICGIISMPQSPHDRCIAQFFVNIVSGNWHRIQKLVFDFYRRSELARSMLCFPAPQLEHCEASFGPVADVRDKDASAVPLFANHAPMLRSIHFSSYLVDQQAPWLCRLHSIVLDDTYSVPDALAILSATHSLQELKIESISNRDMSTSLPVVSLSHLKSLVYNGYSEPGTVAALLGHIEIPIGCSLIIELHRSNNSTRFTEEKPHILSVIHVFTQHAERASQSRIFNDIKLYCNHKCWISFTCQTSLPVECLLSISITWGDSDANLLETFLKKLILLDLTSVKNVDFAAIGRLNPHFVSFFSCLPSVEIISIDLHTLSLLAHLQTKHVSKNTKKPSIFFPKLKIIDLDIHLRSPESTFFVNRVAAAFLLWRFREGHSIATLDISNHLLLDAPPNLDALSEVKGLKVLYKLSGADGVVEYTCGSDDREKNIGSN